MSERSDSEFLSDIQEAIKRIERYARGLEYEQFLRDTKTQDAVIRNLEVMGEAVKGLSADFKTRHGQIQWRKLGGLRDKVIHLPELRARLDQLPRS